MKKPGWYFTFLKSGSFQVHTNAEEGTVDVIYEGNPAVEGQDYKVSRYPDDQKKNKESL